MSQDIKIALILRSIFKEIIQKTPGLEEKIKEVKRKR